jgi:hypothetical protein
MVILLLGATAPRLAAQSDNFNDGNDTSGVAWTHYSLTSFGIPYGGTTYSFPDDGSGGKAYNLSAAATGADPYGVKNARGGSYVKTNIYTTRFSVGTDLLAWSTGGRPEVGLLWYFHDIGLGKSDGYVGTYSVANRNIYISIATNEAQQAYFCRLEDGDITLNATNRIRMVASSHDGSTFVLTVYNLLEPNTPWASTIGSDYTWYGFGTNCGYLVMNEDYPTNYGASATFDNYVATEPAAGAMPAMVTDVYPPPAGKSKASYIYVTNSVMILNRDTSVDTSSILLCLDGVWIPNANLTMDYQVYKQYNPIPYQQSFGGATVTYAIPNVLPWGSKHTNVVVFSDTTLTWYTNIWTWTVAYNYLFASNSLPIGSLSVRGFDVRMAQTTNGGVNLANTLDRARQQLAGLIPVDQRATSIVQVLNWNKNSAYPDNVPGLCPGNNAAPINIAAETCAYLQLTAGPHRFHIITDDRAGVYSGVNLADTSVLWEAPSSTANTTFEFVAEADGLYPIRCLWEETGGSANLALYSVDLNDLTEVLINDSTDPTGVVKAWYPVVCKSASAVAGNYTLATTAVNVLDTVGVYGTGGCSSSVVGQKVTGGTLTLPISGTMQFYRLDAPRKTKFTNISESGSSVVITYQFR